MNILVAAKDRTVARRVADQRYPRDTTEPGTRDSYLTLDDEVTVGIFGGDLDSRTFDRIVVAQQKHLSPSYSDYLCWHLAVGGRFDRAD